MNRLSALVTSTLSRPSLRAAAIDLTSHCSQSSPWLTRRRGAERAVRLGGRAALPVRRARPRRALRRSRPAPSHFDAREIARPEHADGDLDLGVLGRQELHRRVRARARRASGCAAHHAHQAMFFSRRNTPTRSVGRRVLREREAVFDATRERERFGGVEQEVGFRRRIRGGPRRWRGGRPARCATWRASAAAQRVDAGALRLRRRACSAGPVRRRCRSSPRGPGGSRSARRGDTTTPRPGRTSRGARSSPRPRRARRGRAASSSSDDVAPLAPRRVARQRHAGERVAAVGSTRAPRARRAGRRPRLPGDGAHVSSSGLPPALVDEVAELGVRRGGCRVPRTSVRAASPRSGSICRTASRATPGSRAPDPIGVVGADGRDDRDLVRELRAGSPACRGRPSAGRRGAARGPERGDRRVHHRGPAATRARCRRPAGARGRASSAAAAPRRRARPASPSSARTACRIDRLANSCLTDQDAGSPPIHEVEDRPDLLVAADEHGPGR